MRQRVVITGTGAVTPYGAGVPLFEEGLFSGQCAIAPWPPAQEVRGLGCSLAGRVPALDSRRIPREQRRSMPPSAIFACFAADEATQGLSPEELAATGVSIGSTMGSPEALHAFFSEYLLGEGLAGIRSMTFFKVMGHTVAANVAMHLGCHGRMLAPAAACASGLQAVGLGFEAIASGREIRMLCGGADEVHPLTMASFDRLGAATDSTDALTASRPFDRDRKGIVCSEGAGVLLLESLASAQARGAAIYGEIRGFGCTTAPQGMAFPDVASVTACMRQALQDARLSIDDIVYICAHATSTQAGDRAEGTAIAELCGDRVPVSSLKGLLGHTLAASGPLELIACLAMLRRRRYLPTCNLEHPDPACGTLHHIPEADMPMPEGPVLKNSFGLGGCNASILLSTYK